MPTLRSYIIGFVLSVLLTLAAPACLLLYQATQQQTPTTLQLAIIFVALALVQLVVQLIFFLHLGAESKPRWQSMAFWYALFLVVILVGGSLWIMTHLNHEMMPANQVFERENIQPRSHD